MTNYDVIRLAELETMAALLVVYDKLEDKYISLRENVYDNWYEAVDDNIELLKHDADA